MTRDVRSEVVAYVETHGPSTLSEVALGIRAGHVEVLDALRSSCARAPKPEGGSPRATYYDLPSNLPQPASASRKPSRADLLYSVLRDGRPHSRREIFGRVGYMLTNNAASECRARFGVEVECSRQDGEYVYKIVGALGEAAAARTSRGPQLPGPVPAASSSALGAAVLEAGGTEDGAAAPSAPIPGQLSINEAA